MAIVLADLPLSGPNGSTTIVDASGRNPWLIATGSNTQIQSNALLLDACVSTAAGLLMVAGSSLLSPLLGLPQPLLFWAGITIFPFVALLIFLSRQRSVSRLLLVDVVGLNVLWVVASVALVTVGPVAPTALGIAFVLAQAAAVGLFAILQWSAMRRAAPVASAG